MTHKSLPIQQPGQQPGQATADETPTSVVVGFRVPGQMLQCNAGELILNRNDRVLIESDTGPQPGTILLSNEPNAEAASLPKVLRVFGEEEQKRSQDLRAQEKKYVDFCKQRARELNLPIKIAEGEIAFNKTRATFYFTSAGRIDFRELVKDLAKKLHMRIELRQIGVRDAARYLSGMGTCGKELCCSSWLPEFKPVSIRMAKDQNLSLNDDKLTGACGRLKCCLRYEQDDYAAARKLLPKVGKRVRTPDGEGRVRELAVLELRVKVSLDSGGLREYATRDVERIKGQHVAQNQQASKSKKSGKEGGDDKSAKEK